MKRSFAGFRSGKLVRAGERKSQGGLDAAPSELRTPARSLHPAVLDHGFAAALEPVVERSPVRTQLSCPPDERLPDHVGLALYFVVPEALANVAKHSRASRATVRFTRDAAAARIEIAGDGVGGAPDPCDGRSDSGTGLRGLADRVEALDGKERDARGSRS